MIGTWLLGFESRGGQWPSVMTSKAQLNAGGTRHITRDKKRMEVTTCRY